MSYSRWIESRWYTYWDVNSKVEEVPTFTICALISFSYLELKIKLDNCLQEVKELEPEATKKDIAELKKYMLAFIEDVENGKCQL